MAEPVGTAAVTFELQDAARLFVEPEFEKLVAQQVRLGHRHRRFWRSGNGPRIRRQPCKATARDVDRRGAMMVVPLQPRVRSFELGGQRTGGKIEADQSPERERV